MPEKTAQQTTTSAETEQQPATITREEFAKVQQLADSLGANLRKEREASKARETALEDRFAKISEQLTALAQTRSEAPADAGKPDPERQKLEARLKDMEAKLDAERKTRETVEQARLDQEARTALSQALTAKGVTGGKLKAAMALLYDAERRIARDDKGIGFKIKRGEYDDVVPLEQGIDEWFKTDDGKELLPPRDAQGGGTKPGHATAGRPTGGPMTKEEALRQLPGALMAHMGR